MSCPASPYVERAPALPASPIRTENFAMPRRRRGRAGRFRGALVLADETDFIPAVQRVYHTAQHPTHLVVGVLPESSQ